MQITVVDQDTLRQAIADPERYGDLIVRIGGYSEYWRNLSPSLRQTVLGANGAYLLSDRGGWETRG